MPKQKKGKAKIADITRSKGLAAKDMEKVKGGMVRRAVPIKRTIGEKDDCGGNCMGSVPTATGKDIEV
jgi:hypothetical protein